MASSQQHRAIAEYRYAGKAGAMRRVVTVDEEAMHGRRHWRRARLDAIPNHPINRQARVGTTTSGTGSGGEL